VARDRVGEFLREKTPRRFIALASFAALIVVFRQLFLLLVFFIAFQRALAFLCGRIEERLGVSKRKALLGLVGSFVVVSGVAGALEAGRVSRALVRARDTFPERMQALEKSPYLSRVREHLPGVEKVVESASHYASDALHVLSAVGHLVLYALIGLILALVFLLEEHELDAWRRSVDPKSLGGTLARWAGHVADAISVTVQLQMIVAACNTVLTLPLLFWLGASHKIALMLLIFVSGLVPVVGNIVSGTVLTLLAHQHRGWLGVGVFVALTFVLHKLEAYYLNPRLTARHVKLPGFLLVASLLAWEHLIGFAGLFVSFPFLFVAGRIRAEMRAEDAEEARAASRGEESEEPPG
jgi:predicted PurR-regulated permease PerM